MSAQELRAAVLRYLHSLVETNGARYTTVGRIKRALKTPESMEFLKVIIDDLQASGLAHAKDGPNFGKNLIEITAAGIDWVREHGPSQPVSSESWTGRRQDVSLSVSDKDALLNELTRIEPRISELPISNFEKSQVRALVLSARVLAEAPEPPYDVVWEIISRTSDIATVAALLATVYQILKIGH
jgi:hypothetical protein